MTPLEASDAIPLYCPRCGKPLSALKGDHGSLAFYHCLRHGRFWIDADGRLREERRAADRPKLVGR